jgi:DNA mismatch repair protein MutL
MGKIQVLDDHTINQIAAGEVIERPASVVKELVENSLDAGAKNIWIRVEEGGTALIIVRDDGTGMDKEDAILAFKKHSTSKIRSFDDLNTVGTSGFRGEALPSIASVSRLRITTAEKESKVGTRITIEGNEGLKVEDHAAPQGTTIEVADLFFNTPARSKHLKKVSTELQHIVKAVTIEAIRRPDVAFNLVHGERKLIDAPGSDLKTRIGVLLRREAAKELIEIKGEENGLKVSGYLTRPAVSRKTMTGIYIHINGRPVQARNICYSIRGAYGSLLHDGHFPIGALFLEIPAQDVDVNVHPAKTIVRIAQEEKVNQELRRILKNILTEQALISHVNLDATRTDSIFGTPLGGISSKTKAVQASNIDSLQQEFSVDLQEGENIETTLPSMRPLSLIENKYIVAMGLDGLYIIDFHAAHERVMYERLKDQARFKRVGKQDLLKPISLELSKSEANAFEEMLPQITGMGFDAEKFGPSSFMIRSVPALLAGSEPERIREAIDDIVESGSMKSAEEKHTYMMYTVACHSALRAGDKLTMAQMEFVIREMESIPNPYACVHGRPTVMTITTAELDKKFKRSGF